MPAAAGPDENGQHRCGQHDNEGAAADSATDRAPTTHAATRQTAAPATAIRPTAMSATAISPAVMNAAVRNAGVTTDAHAPLVNHPTTSDLQLIGAVESPPAESTSYRQTSLAPGANGMVSVNPSGVAPVTFSRSVRAVFARTSWATPLTVIRTQEPAGPADGSAIHPVSVPTVPSRTRFSRPPFD